MYLRDVRLLLVILGVSNSKLQRVEDQDLNLYNRATSSEGVLCIRKYWESHSSTFSKVPALAVLAPGSIPQGLTPALFLELLARLTDLQQWQIWELWTTLDIHSCGLVGCAEFMLLVVLLCAGAAQQQIQAVHAYAGSISRVFLGAHVGSSHAGLLQCCQLMALPVSGLFTALKQQRVQQEGVSSSGCYGTHSSSGSSPCIPAGAAQEAGHVPDCKGSSCNSCCSNIARNSACTSSPAGRSNCTSSNGAAGVQDAATAGGANTAAPAAPAAAAGPSNLGCCCKHAGNQSQAGQQQWACGAAAHRLQAMQGSANCRAAAQQGDSLSGVQCWATLMSAEDVELILYQVAEQHARWQSGSDKGAAEDFAPGCCGSCTIC